jgi:hypothetical protein
MKRICLIRGTGECWRRIEEFLGGVNAAVVVMDGEPRQEEVMGHHPDLLITDSRVHHNMLRWLGGMPVIVVKEGTPPTAMLRETAGRNLLITGWPLERSRFLDITSNMLSIAPRRVFRTLIRIFSEGDDIGSLGQSTDFSLSGLAFKTENTFSHGNEITISFSIPEASRSLRIRVEIVRKASAGEDGRSVYGARFLEIDAEDRRLLTTFILGG